MVDRRKILFVNPPLSSTQRYGVLSKVKEDKEANNTLQRQINSLWIEPPLGLTSLAAVTKKMGFNTIILDVSALTLSLEESLQFVLEEKPDFLCITLTTVSLSAASAFASTVKQNMPEVKIIVGGCHFTSLPEKTMLENSHFDFGIIGEGEKTIEELLIALINKKEISSIKGIAFRNENRIVLTPKRERIEDLDELPMPAFDLLPELGKYYRTSIQSMKCFPTVSLITSRGCAGKCTFCDKSTFGNKIRMHSAEYVVDMMAHLKQKFGIRGILFEDDNFMLSQERLERLAKLIKKRKLRMNWAALSRIDTMNEEKVKLAKSCGCWQILYGIESGSQKILDFFEKGVSIEETRETILLTKRYGIYTKGFFMWGNPLETKETLQETRDLIFSIPFDDISLTFFTPYPGAPIWDTIDNFGRCCKDWDKLTCFDMVFVPNGMTENELINSYAQTLREFYRQPRVIWSYATRLRSLAMVKELHRTWRILSKLAN